jgi:hypothetical protein
LRLPNGVVVALQDAAEAIQRRLALMAGIDLQNLA